MKVTCQSKHRMVPIVPDLLLCECSSYGRLSIMAGAVEDARRLANSVGGVEAIRDRIEQQEQARKLARAAEKQERLDKITKGVRTG